MPDPRGFLRVHRRLAPARPVAARLGDDRHQYRPAPEALVREQSARCMGCGVPFCHAGCPLENLVPDWIELVRTGRHREAAERLHETNNFPELTGRLCPAPCEEACVLALNDDPVTIKQVELAIADRAFASGWVRPMPAATATGRSVAVIGSGPAGLAAAQQLARAGHAVTVFERDEAPGGLLRFGIPDFKLEKRVVDRRIDQLEAEGVRFEMGADVGGTVEPEELRSRFDALLLATGAQRPRPLDLPGAELAGVHPAMAYLTQRNRDIASGRTGPGTITAAGKDVVVIGGGDTSADCLGCALREGARSVTEIAHGPVPPRRRTPLATWPAWPRLLRTYAAHEEGGRREWGIEPTRITGGGTARRVQGRRPDEDVELPADLVLVATGFAGVEDDPVYPALGVSIRAGLVAAADAATSAADVYAAGDCVRGAALIVTAIAEGRATARRIHADLAGRPGRRPHERRQPASV